MANKIIINNSSFSFSNQLLDTLYISLLDVYEKRNEKYSTVKSLIMSLDQDYYGLGCISLNVDDFLKTKSHLIFFCEVFNQARLRASQKYSWPNEFVQKITSFYEEPKKLVVNNLL